MLSRLMTIREQVILAGLALALFTGAVVIGTRSTDATEKPVVITTPSPQIQELKPTKSTEPEVEVAPPQIVVGVLGAVQNSGLYHLPEDTRIMDLIEAAGGTTAIADITDLNLAARLMDGTTLDVPITDARPPINPAEYTLSGTRASYTSAWIENTEVGMKPASTFTPSTTRVNLNSAKASQLETLPGIGPVTAEKIITFRRTQPFQSVQDLLQVNGIGPKKLEAIAPLVRIQ